MENKYNVSADFWDRLSLEGRNFFNMSYEAMMKYKDLIPHPKTRTIGESHWHTIAFKSAWLNTCIYMGFDMPIILGDNDTLFSDN